MGNIVVFMADEFQARALGAVGHPVAQTPNLDRLAASGTLFTNCWTPSPICVSARVGFATGRWCHQVEAWDSTAAYDGEPNGWAHRARARGYHTASFGKLHHHADTDDGFAESVLPMYLANGVGWVQGLIRDPLPDYPEAAELAADVGIGPTSYTDYDRNVTEAACRWLVDRVESSEPFVAFVSYVSPHYPLAAPEEFTALYDEIPPPEIPAVEPTNPAVAAAARFWDYDRYFDDYPEDRRAMARRAYFGLCSFVDDQIGQVLSTLEATGLDDDTHVIFTSDHGEFLGNRGLWCKSMMYRDSVAIPMIATGPGFEPGATSDARCNLIDVAATIDDLTGSDLGDADLAGHSLLDHHGWGDRLGFSEYHDGGSVTGSFAVAWDQWKYVHHVGAPPELFDVAADPDELNDLATDGRETRRVAEGEEALRSIVDPDEANTRAFAAQRQRIEELGGPDAIRQAFRFNHTPVPTT